METELKNSVNIRVSRVLVTIKCTLRNKSRQRSGATEGFQVRLPFQSGSLRFPTYLAKKFATYCGIV